MVIYHLFLNGRHKFKTNSMEEILDCINSLPYFDVCLDYIFDGLITKHEYHFYDFEGNRKIDIIASIVG